MGTLTISTTAAQDARIVAAVGKRLGLGRDATAAEVKAFVIADIVRIVREGESDTAITTALAGVTPIAPT